jgi:hypothetical protein
MCPLCIGTAAWLVSSGASAGGIAALVFRRRTRKSRRERPSSSASRGPAGRDSTHAPSVVFKLKDPATFR